MSCYHPIPGYQHKTMRNPETGKLITKISASFIPSDPDNWNEIMVPCGQCVGCRLDYSREWAARILMECKEYKNNWFLTITYDPEHVPFGHTINKETGELIENMTLVPKDLQDFLKRLRRSWEYDYRHKGIRFFACGEYGEKYGRPHYHLCVMNLPIPDEELEFMFTNHEGDQIFNCEKIRKIWGKGLISVGQVTFNSAAYVARYIMKKQKGPDADWYYQSQGKAKEFTRMSLKPGIGAKYYETNKERIYQYDNITLPKGRSSITVKPPAYFDKLYDLDEPENLTRIKQARREKAERAETTKEKATSLYPWQQREIEERSKKESIKKLIRKLD